MYKDDKKYHMDLKENARGRFLKVSETFTRGYSRFQVGKSNQRHFEIPPCPRFSFLRRVWTSSSRTWAS